MIRFESSYISHTKQGNPYEKTNNGKKLGLIIPATLCGTSAATATAVLVRENKNKIHGVVDFLKLSGMAIWKSKPLPALLFSLGFGALLDAAINFFRRRKADKF